MQRFFVYKSIKPNHMERKHKEQYESPATEAVEIKMESGLLTGSPDYSLGTGNPFSGNPDEIEW